VYGDSDPTLTYSLSESVAVTGALARAAGSDVGSYAINLGTLSAGTNYELSLSTPVVNFAITARPITVTADAKHKVFGAPDPALTWQLTSGNLVGSDAVTGNLTRVAGEAVGSYAIQQGTLTAGSNYLLTYVGANLTIGAWTVMGFHQPVGVTNSLIVAGSAPAPDPTTVWNVARGGSTVPLKFNVFAGSAEVTSAAVATYSATKLQSCLAGATDTVETDMLTSGSTSLRYSDGQWIQNWATPKVNADTCYRATITFNDGTTLSAFFRLRK
ncbi:MAG TPA: MBG domain-containing protein, partial [Candidatus Limnocylindrales bacterium]|nr:MBG domain-containing protein [Candidatus Limnocylindrales bacterium]